MDFALDLYYKPTRLLLSVIGLWPHQPSVEKTIMLALTIFLVITQGYLQVGGLITAWCNLDIFLESIPLVSIDFVCWIKIINFMYNADKENVESDIGLWLSGGLYGSMVPFMLAPLFPMIQKLLRIEFMVPANETIVRPLLFHVEYLLDVDKWYYYLLIHSYLATIAYVTIVVAVDSMFMAYAQHACSLLAIVRYVEMIESAFTVSLLGQTSINMLCISFTGFQAVMKLDHPEESIRYASFMLAQMFPLFMSSYPPQCVATESEHLLQFTSYWYLTSIRTRKLLNLLILRCTRPCQLTAGRFYVLNIEYFSTVMRTSMSYLTMLCSFRETVE